MPIGQHTYSAARRELEQERAQVALEEPMHRYTFPIPRPRAAACSPAPEGVAECLPTPERDRLAQQLEYQNQLLADLLGAVNALTAALLCRKECP